MGSLPKNDFRVFCTNVRSLRQNFDSVRLFLESCDTEFHLIVLTESWIKKSELNLFCLEGYSSFHQERSKGRSGGVTVYIRKDVPYEITLLSNAAHESILVKIMYQKMPFSILCSYRNVKSKLLNFLNDLDKYQNNEETRFNILLGDINQDIFHENNLTSCSIDYLNFMSSHGFETCILGPTRTTASTQTTIDHLFAKTSLSKFITAQCIETGISDHHSIIFNVNNVVEKNTNCKMYTFRDIRLIKSYLDTVNWREKGLYDENDVNTAYSIVKEEIVNAIQVATITVPITNKNTKKKDWISQELINLCHKKNRMYRQLKLHPFNDSLRKELKELQNVIKSSIRKAKETFYTNKFKEAKDTKQFWKITNAILKGNKKQPIQAINVGGIKTAVEKNEKTVAEEFNKYFATVADNLLKQQSVSGPPVKIKHEQTSMFSPQLTIAEIDKAFKKLKNKKSSGIDGISCEVIKICREALICPLYHVFKLSLSHGIYPTELKTSKIVPVYKEGDKSETSQYRPIHVQPAVGKLLEFIVQDRLLRYLEKIKFLSENQFGFRPGSSTELAVAEYTSAIITAIEEGKKVSVGQADLSKCFDIVNHTLMLLKIKGIGVQNELYSWFESYFADRFQVVELRTNECVAYSTPQPIKHGIFQGSGLGPLLFLIYINELAEMELHSKILCYADDIAFITSAPTAELLESHLQDDTAAILQWIEQHKLVPNIKKTKVMHIHYNNNEGKLGVKYKNFTIEPVTEMMYLGVTIDCKMNWGSHTSKLHQSLRKLNLIFYNIRKFLSKQVLMPIYNAHYLQKLSYCIIIWGGAAQKYIRPLETMQNFTLKLITRTPRLSHSDTVYFENNTPQMKTIYNRQLKIFAQKHIVQTLNPEQKTYNTRSVPTLPLPPWLRTLSRNSTMYKAIEQYNISTS